MNWSGWPTTATLSPMGPRWGGRFGLLTVTTKLCEDERGDLFGGVFAIPHLDSRGLTNFAGDPVANVVGLLANPPADETFY